MFYAEDSVKESADWFGGVTFPLTLTLSLGEREVPGHAFGFVMRKAQSSLSRIFCETFSCDLRREDYDAGELMLCAKCKERPATVHFSIVDGGSGPIKKVDLCEECAAPEMGAQKGTELSELMEMLKSGNSSPVPITEDLIGGGGRYQWEAYEFVREALREHQRDKSEHVGGRELLETLRELALRKFGKGARRALAKWNIFRTEDFGEIVFELVEAGLFSKTPDDSKEDFANGFSFEDAFPEE